MAKKADVLSSLADDIKTSVPYYKNGTVVVDVDLNMYNDYFASLYNSIVSHVHPSSTVVPPDLILEEEFVLICKYFLKARLDFVYGRALGASATNRLTIPGVHLPQPLFRLLRNIGTVQVFAGYVNVVPKPEQKLEDAFAALKTSHKLFSRFSNLVESFPNRRWSSASPSMMDSEVGSPFWLLSVRDVENRGQVAKNRHSVVVLAAFPEWTAQDALLAAIAQNGYDGVFEDYNVIYRSNDIKDALIIRQQFNLHVTA